MKLITKKLSTILATAFLVTSFAACNKGNGGSQADFIGFNPVTETSDVYRDCYIANKGSSNYVVIIEDNAERYEEYAANELVKYIQEATGVKLRIVKESTAPAGDQFISIGQTQRAIAAGITVNVDELGYSGFILKSNEKGNVFITAACQEAVCYGVYEFLTKHVGFEAYSIDELVVNKTFMVPLQKMDETVLPVIENRMFEFGHYMTNANLPMRLDYGQGGGSTISKGRNMDLWAHSIGTDLGINKSTHPEYFPTTQFCMTQEGGASLIANAILPMIRRSMKDSMTLQIGHLDTQSTCTCPTCTISDEENGGAGGTYIIFLNQVSDELEKLMEAENIEKDVTLCALAYFGYEPAPAFYNEATQKYEPVNENVICKDNVTVMYAPINACHYHAFNDPACEFNRQSGYYDNFMGWSVVTNKHFSTWTYNFKSTNLFAVYNDFGAYVENAKFFEEIGVYYTFYQGNQWNDRASFDAFRAYMVSKLSWDTSLKFEDLFNNFFNNYYKEAAPALIEYYNAVQAHYATLYDKFETGGCGGFFQVKHNYAEASDWDYLLLRNFKEILDKGFKAIEKSNRSPEEKEILRQRVLVESISIDAMIKESYPLYIEDYASFIKEFEAGCRLLGMERRTEAGGAI